MAAAEKHWSQVEYLQQSVTNPNIVIKGSKSHYSNAYTPDFEDYVVCYFYGDFGKSGGRNKTGGY